TDSFGNEKFYKVYGHDDWTIGWSIAQTSDGGFALLGNSTETDPWLDFRLTKIDSLGNEEWTKFYGRSSDDTGSCVKQTSNGGYILTGSSGGWSSSPVIWVIRVDSSGSQLWDKTYGGANSDHWDSGYDVTETSDGNFVILGRIYDNSNSNYNIALIKLDSDGNELWFKRYGGLQDDSPNEFAALDDGYAICGVTSSSGSAHTDIYFIKTDVNGNISYTRTFGDSNNNSSGGIASISDTQFAIVGQTTLSADNTNIDFIHFNTSGYTSQTILYENQSGNYVNSSELLVQVQNS
ncbi:MAG: lipoprotein, partial [Candidatus Magnetoglobus multicellularis str. Araruama]